MLNKELIQKNSLVNPDIISSQDSPKHKKKSKCRRIRLANKDTGKSTTVNDPNAIPSSTYYNRRLVNKNTGKYTDQNDPDAITYGVYHRRFVNKDTGEITTKDDISAIPYATYYDRHLVNKNTGKATTQNDPDAMSYGTYRRHLNVKSSTYYHQHLVNKDTGKATTKDDINAVSYSTYYSRHLVNKNTGKSTVQSDPDAISYRAYRRYLNAIPPSTYSQRRLVNFEENKSKKLCQIETEEDFAIKQENQETSPLTDICKIIPPEVFNNPQSLLALYSLACAKIFQNYLLSQTVLSQPQNINPPHNINLHLNTTHSILRQGIFSPSNNIQNLTLAPPNNRPNLIEDQDKIHKNNKDNNANTI